MSSTRIQIVHQLPGRVRIYCSRVRESAAYSSALVDYCQKLPGVWDVQICNTTGRILFYFDHFQLQTDGILQMVEEFETIWQQSQTCAAGPTAAVTSEHTFTDGSAALQPDWHSFRSNEVLEALNSHDRFGLRNEEVMARFQYFGKNMLPESMSPRWYQTFMKQFLNFTTFTMISIAALPIFFGRIRDTGGILVLLGVNSVIGTRQQQKAQRDIRSLKKLGTQRAKVIRNGHERNVPADELIPGDILLLEAGDRIPADAILLEGWNVETDESSLTGESMPVRKQADAFCETGTPLAERKNMVYMGTIMTKGRARAIIVATGARTEIGKVIKSMQMVQTRPTPLQKKLAVVARTIVLTALSIAGVVVLLRLMQGYTFAETMLTGVSIATTAISEGLPIMITVSLVAGMRRMVQHKAIVKEMSALETLAKVDVICTDKTGTLTKNEMTVKAVIGSNHEWFVTGDGYQPIGEFYEHGEKVNLHQDHPLVWLSTLGVLCNDSEIETPKRNSIQQTGSPSIHGDPTEAALVVTAMKAGLDPGKLRAEWSRIREIPFDSARRCMLVVCKNQAGEYLVCMKGSIDIVMEKCRSMQQGNQVVDFTTRLRTKVIEQERQQAKRAMRVLGIAYKKVIQNPEFMSEEELEADLIWTGMFAMKDPPREHVRDSIAVCQNAGIHVVMITGDHSITATAIGCELGIIRPGERVLTGQEVARMSDEQLQSALNEVKVFSRVSPTDKQRIVKCFQNQGKQVAMLGDGVNDAPSLKQADIGIALGTGTDAAKEAASFILTNNDFGVVVKAIRQGRYVLGNIRSTIGYIFLGNLSEVLYAALTVVAGLPLALMPMQMMFMNMLTDSLPTLLLTIGHPATHRDQPISAPLSSVKEVFDRSFISRVIASGVVVGLSTAALFFGVNAATGNIQLAGTAALAALCLGKLLQIPYWRQSAVDSEKPRMDSLMKLTLGMGIVGLLLAIYLPSLRFLFNSVPLGIGHWILILATVLVGRILVPLLTSLLDKKLKQQNLLNMSHLSFPRLKFAF